MSNLPTRSLTAYNKLVHYYVYSVGVLLLITSASKLISACGSSKILHVSDPLLGISFRWLFLIVGLIEFGVAIFCLCGNAVVSQAKLAAWLATNMFAYRVGLLCIAYHKPCPCLGSLTATIHLRPESADTMLKFLLGYILIGSYSIFLWNWKQQRQPLALNLYTAS